MDEAEDARLRAAVEALPVGFAVFDADGAVVLWNAAYAEMHPQSAGLQVGMRSVDHSNAAPFRDTTRDEKRADGRWIRIEDVATADGGGIRLCTDVTIFQEREESFRYLFDANPLPMHIFDTETLAFLAVNDAALALYGYSRAEFLTLTALDIRPEFERAVFRHELPVGDTVPYGGRRAWLHLRADGTWFDVVTYSKAISFEGHAGSLNCVIDASEHTRIASELNRTQAFLDSVVGRFPAEVSVKDMTDDDGRSVFDDKASQSLTKRAQDNVVGRADFDLLGSAAATSLDPDALRSLITRKLPIPAGLGIEPRFPLGIAQDVTEMRAMEARIAHMAHHDPLTNLPNRVLFRDRLETALGQRHWRGEQLALICIDLDHFKDINDTLGHSVGDKMLLAFSQRLRETVPATQTIARLGGDEFAVILMSRTGSQEPTIVAARLIALLGMPYTIDGKDITTGLSIGIAIAPSDADDPDNLLRDAVFALYQAKADQRGSFRFFESEMNLRAQKRHALEKDLRGALEAGQFELYYQPQVELATRRICGFEALLRWRHPDHGMISPADFVPVTEEIGLIVPIGEWLLRQACRHAASWPASITIAVNLSPVQMDDHGIVDVVRAALEWSGLAPERLELEITESVVLLDNIANVSTLHRLRDLGVQIALDDFGTGYSSLSYLRSFPFNKIKIDRSFIQDLATRPECLAIIHAVTRLASRLGMSTTAEGVETADQLETVRREGCEQVQGYFFGRPQPAADATALIQSETPVPPVA